MYYKKNPLRVGLFFGLFERVTNGRKNSLVNINIYDFKKRQIVPKLFFGNNQSVVFIP